MIYYIIYDDEEYTNFVNFSINGLVPRGVIPIYSDGPLSHWQKIMKYILLENSIILDNTGAVFPASVLRQNLTQGQLSLFLLATSELRFFKVITKKDYEFISHLPFPMVSWLPGHSNWNNNIANCNRSF